MANQNSNGVNGSVVEVSEATELFRQFLAQSNMSLDDKGVIVREETVGESVDVWFDKVIENVQEEIDTAGLNDDMEVAMATETVVCYVQKGKNGITINKLDNALKSGAPVIEFKLRHGLTNKDTMSALKSKGFVFKYSHHDAERNVVRNMSHKKGLAPNYVSIMGRNSKKRNTKGLHRFELA